MKKFVLGVLVGVVIASCGSAYADDVIDSIVGKQVQGSFPVKVDGKQLSSSAAVIDGTSYLPVRAVGEALNKEVTFDADLGIELKSKGGTQVPDTTTNDPYSEQNKRSKHIQELTDKINELTPLLDEENHKLFPYENVVLIDNKIGKKEKDAFYEETVAKRDELNSQILKLRTELDAAIKENNDIATGQLQVPQQ